MGESPPQTKVRRVRFATIDESEVILYRPEDPRCLHICVVERKKVDWDLG